MQFFASRIEIKMENLFNGNKELEESITAVLNENIEALTADFQPQINRAVSKVIIPVIKEIIEAVSIDDLFLT